MEQNKVLKVLFWNANGIRNKKAELIMTLNIYDVDVALINETKLNENLDFEIPNYLTYRNDRGIGKGGGTAILVHKTVKHVSIKCPRMPELEATIIVVQFDGEEIALGAVYNAPESALDQDGITKLLSVRPMTILAGDLNAKHNTWNSLEINTKGKNLYEHAAANGYTVKSPSTPTHFNHEGRGDFLDIAILRNITNENMLWSLPELSSDHNPVLFAMNSFRKSTTTLSLANKWVEYLERINSYIDWCHFATPMLFKGKEFNTDLFESEAIKKLTIILDRHSDLLTYFTEKFLLLVVKKNILKAWYQINDNETMRVSFRQLKNVVKETNQEEYSSIMSKHERMMDTDIMQI